MIAFAYLEKADFWYGLERKYDYRNYKEMVGESYLHPSFYTRAPGSKKEPFPTSASPQARLSDVTMTLQLLSWVLLLLWLPASLGAGKLNWK